MKSVPSHAMRAGSLLGLLACLGLGACGDSPAGSSRDNVLFLTLDTTRRDHMGFHGRDPSPTPHLDRLAAESIIFEDAFTVAPLTLPAHVSLFTGLYPVTHGVRDNSSFRLSEQATSLVELLRDVGYHTGAAVAAAVLDGTYGLDQGFETYTAPRREAGEDTVHYASLPAEEMVSHALERIHGLPEPFAFWLHLFDPHVPYEEHHGDPPARSSGPERAARLYEGEIRYADEQIGRLLRDLRKQPYWDRLLIVFASDHGEGLSDGLATTHGYFVDDQTMRIPLFLRHPRLAPRRVKEVVSLVDVAPTLAGWLGLRFPGGRTDGVDLAPILRGEGGSERLAVALESYYVYWSFGWAPYEGLVNGEWKFIRSRTDELFDRRNDPHSKRNLFDPRDPESSRWLERIEERFATPSDPALVVQYGASGEEIESLAALGYAVGAEPEVSARTEFHTLDDAKQKLDVIERLPDAREALARGEVDRALEMMEQNCLAEPDSAFFHFEYASNLLAARPERWREAQEALERTVALNFHRPDAFFNLGTLYLQRWEEAAAEARRLTEDGDPSAARARTREGKQARTRAANAYRQALARDPLHVEALGSLARMLQLDAGQALAKGDLEQAVELHREVVRLLTDLVGALPETDRTRGAVEETLEAFRERLANLQR